MGKLKTLAGEQIELKVAERNDPALPTTLGTDSPPHEQIEHLYSDKPLRRPYRKHRPKTRGH